VEHSLKNCFTPGRHISQTPSRVCSSCFSELIIEKYNYFASDSDVPIICLLIGSRTSSQTRLLIIHSSSEWHHESSAPHNVHAQRAPCCSSGGHHPLGIDCLTSRQLVIDRHKIVMRGPTPSRELSNSVHPICYPSRSSCPLDMLRCHILILKASYNLNELSKNTCFVSSFNASCKMI
jgi:hypothetical protein